MVTGLGPVTSIGVGRDSFDSALRAGVSGIGPVRSETIADFVVRHGGEITAYDPAPAVRRLDPATLGRCSQFAIAATHLALFDAGLSPEDLRKSRVSVSLGTTDGEADVVDRLTRRIAEQGIAGDHRELAVRSSPGDLAANVLRELDVSGKATVFATACAAGNYGVCHAYDLIRAGEVDIGIGGGADSISRKAYAGFIRLGAVADDTCRPFDGRRQGMVPGEAAAAIVLESLEGARRRGATIQAEVLGYALACDAKHATAPDAERIAACIMAAHTAAGVTSEMIDYICAHGTGTRLNDSVEVEAVRRVFGTPGPPLSSIKSMLGHTMGAASALGVVASCLAIMGGYMPPTINWTTPDPACSVDCVPNEPRAAPVRIVENHGFAFGGNNSVLLLGAPPSAA